MELAQMILGFCFFCCYQPSTVPHDKILFLIEAVSGVTQFCEKIFALDSVISEFVRKCKSALPIHTRGTSCSQLFFSYLLAHLTVVMCKLYY